MNIGTSESILVTINGKPISDDRDDYAVHINNRGAGISIDAVQFRVRGSSKGFRGTQLPRESPRAIGRRSKAVVRFSPRFLGSQFAEAGLPGIVEYYAVVRDDTGKEKRTKMRILDVDTMAAEFKAEMEKQRKQIQEMTQTAR